MGGGQCREQSHGLERKALQVNKILSNTYKESVIRFVCFWTWLEQ